MADQVIGRLIAGTVWALEGTMACRVLEEMKVINDCRWRARRTRVSRFKKPRPGLHLVFHPYQGKPPSAGLILMSEPSSRTYSAKLNINPSGAVIAFIGERLPSKRIHEAAGALLALIRKTESQPVLA